MKRVIMPKRNEKDLADLPAPLREDLELVFAERIDQVLAAALTGPPPAVGV
jgi:ATP-dependent Lon protease